VISDIVLDHVAIAVERHSDVFPMYARDLGGRWQSGGFSGGFAPVQLQFAAGIRLEILAPHHIEENDFLRRFLDGNGPGPHHLTFKVGDIAAALAEAEAAGYRPVNVDLSQPQWKEAFLHPKDALGTVIQLAQSTEGEWRSPPPEGFTQPVDHVASSLIHVAHALPSLPVGLRLFAGLLGGREEARGEDRVGRWVDLTWPGPGRIRLVEPSGPASPLAEWIGPRPGRVHHLAFVGPDPATVRSASPQADGPWEVAPERNFGVRLQLGSPWFPAPR
jgi:methylmalonyl-CoA/ethylmalonyl-CoA epimerase